MFKPISLLSFCFFCILQYVSAQDTSWFTHGIAIGNVHHYGREALYTDQVAYGLYTGTLVSPVAGQSSGIADAKGNDIKWEPVEADSLKRFHGRGQGGYIYLTYTAEKRETALLNITGNSTVFFNGVAHAGDPYSSGWLYIPVKLKKGLNELYVRTAGPLTAKIIFTQSSLQLNTEDLTLPNIVQGSNNSALQGAVVIINLSAQDMKGLQIKSLIGGKELVTDVPAVPRMSSRKVPFLFNAGAITEKGRYDCGITLMNSGKQQDEKKITVEATSPGDKYTNTFISGIDGCLQYYAVTPQLPAAGSSSALFLSVHGAGVEAIGQAKAYHSKDWGTLVAATNRRPRGFNWEDWGRLDALEVLAIAKEKFKPDPQHIYLTGHSMGGHGTWFLGATYPDQWAAIGACSGYPTLKDYGSADGAIPVAGATGAEQMLLRASNQSDVVKLATNYKPFGVYILHGDSDKVVPVKYARQMRKVLADFHADMSYYEYPGGEHWFGDQSVDWKPLFDFFKWHSRAADSAVNNIDFITASPGISSKFRWATIQQQVHPLQYSHITLTRNRKKNTIAGTTDNVRVLKLALADFDIDTDVNILLDSLNNISYHIKAGNDNVYLVKENNQWSVTPRPDSFQKGPERYGTFKDPFNHNMIFVYSTKGTAAENDWSFNKARYDAETWYYRGNGAIDIIADKDYSIDKYAGRNVILYGNATTNSIYNLLLKDCPVRIDRNNVTAGTHSFKGDDLGAYFMWPLKSAANTSVGVIGGTGLKGMMAVNANQYFAGASGFPDFMIFDLGMLQSGATEIKLTGFFDNNWKLSETEIAQ